MMKKYFVVEKVTRMFELTCYDIFTYLITYYHEFYDVNMTR